jgi:Carboxypeptidase regulatory-like domain
MSLCPKIGRGMAIVVLSVFVVFCVPAMSLGQSISSGTIQGVVTDPSGAAVVGATVTLTNTDTSTSRTGVTNDAGNFNFANMPPANYDLSVSKPGFRVTKLTKQELTVGAILTLDLKLEIGSTAETIEVFAVGSTMETASATVGNTLTGIPLDNLPGLGRDVSTFVSLQPGVAPDGSVAGANQDQNSFMLDGGNNSSDMDGTQNTYTPSFAGDPSGGLVNNQVTATAPGGSPGGGGPTGVMPTPADSIEEFKVGTNNQTADFNSSAGAQVQLVTKRGTNQWHGTAYEYYLVNAWAANSFDNNAAGNPKPSFHYNRFGAAGGGPLISKNVLGGKWYFFGNYEGFRWNQSASVFRIVPSAALEQGILQFGTTAYNLNPTAVTYNGPATPALTPGQVVAPAVCPAGPCDPRGLGISPTVQSMWTQFMPASNTSSCLGLSRCDHLNVLGFTGNMLVPWSDNFGVARLDHDFGAKWHFYASYRYYKMARATGNQVDIGGFYPGDKLGTPASVSSRPQVPWYLTAGLTTNITSSLTNDFHYSFLRNFWARASNGQTPQIGGLAGALEPFGEQSKNVLAPVNLDTQDVRTRFWDGQDHMIRDDLSWSKGKHFLQFGGTYQRNWNYHQRTDNGGGINYQTVYWLGSSVGSTNGMDMTGYTPAAITASQSANWQRDYGAVLGVPGVTQIAYTRTGSSLALNPPNTPAFDQSTIPFYNLYASDSWRIKPTLTLSYGLGWSLEMPPVEKNGKQIVMVDANNKPLDTEVYLHAREAAALQGQVYNPEIGFSLVHNVTGSSKYPYNPFYKGFSPRVAAAWNPSFDGGLLGSIFGQNKTVLRGGYSILYGRLNGVGLVLIPLLGDGLIQAVQCVSPLSTGACGGPGGATPNTAFRIGPTGGGFDGLTAPLPAAAATLPQPLFPGFNAVAAGAGTGLDPTFRPSMSHQFDFTVQRQLNNKFTMEVGYIGRLLRHEFMPLQINTVPYMMTLGGQRFDKAYGQMVMQYCGGNAGMAGGNCAGNLAAVTPQPFFETALNPAYCAGFASCTQAVASKEGANGTGNIPVANVWSLWNDLDAGAFNFPRSMLSTPIAGSANGSAGQLSSAFVNNTSLGTGNYNGMFVSMKMSQWHGISLQSNFTFSKALGTVSEVQATSQFTSSDPFDLNRNYGLQPWDRKFMFNTWLVYQPPFFAHQHGIVGRLLGGWTVAPILDIGSGLPLAVFPGSWFANGETYGGGQSFGESDANNVGALENAINICGGSAGGSQRHNHPVASSQYPDIGSSGFGPSLYQDPGAVYNCFRNPILGIDNGHNGGAGTLRGQAFWNVDFNIKKNVAFTERVSLEVGATFTNIFNHNQLFDPLNGLGDTGDFGALSNGGVGQVNNPRRIEISGRLRF